MRNLKIKNNADVKKLLALVGESCDKSIICNNQLEMIAKEKNWKIKYSRLVTIYVKCSDKDFCIGASIVYKDNKDNKCGKDVIQYELGDTAAQVPMEDNNITDVKKATIEFVEFYILEFLKRLGELSVDVDVVGD